MEHCHNQKPDTSLIYFHEKRPEWGHALFLHQREDKQTYQFEDGKERVFKGDYCGFLKPVDAPADQTALTLTRLGARAQAHKVTTASRKLNALPFATQLAYFKHLYPTGFSGTKWKKSKRGFDAKRRIKRHRNPAIHEVQNLLGEVQLASALAQGQSAMLWCELVAALASGNLLTKTQLADLRAVTDKDTHSVLSALRGVLHDAPETLAVGFERWLTALEHATKKAPTIELATVPLALAQPGRHACIKRSSFARQAAWMAPRLAKERRVTGAVYLRWLEMVERIRAGLRTQGLSPQDNLDVYDFIVDTMKPKSIAAALQLAADQVDEALEAEEDDQESMSA